MTTDGSGFETILYQVEGEHTAVITMNRPERLNASTDQMRTELGQAWKIVREDPAIRVAIITGAGDRAFSAGQDVKATAAQGKTRNKVPGSRAHHDVFKPVICAVNGLVTGGGLHHVAESDLVICSENARFLDTHCAVGNVFALEAIGLSRKMPLAMVMQLGLLTRQGEISPERAHQVGLVNEVVPPETLMPRALEMAAHIATLSPATVQASLRAIWGSLDVGLKPALDIGWRHILHHQQNHPDYLEGMKAFAEKRAPNWTVD
ncbi:MAG: enoyl-CoA hydratase-related protein [Gemmatimonadales bacterium]|jgi:enoyl-CoA hydratase/carnithine racemase